MRKLIFWVRGNGRDPKELVRYMAEVMETLLSNADTNQGLVVFLDPIAG